MVTSFTLQSARRTGRVLRFVWYRAATPIRRAAWTRQAHDDWRRSPQSLRALIPSGPHLTDAIARLRSLHSAYVSSVSTADMALSLQTASLVDCLARQLKPNRILDLGSGFSTLVLASAAPSAVVVSVDDSPVWLSRTRDYLTAQGVTVATLAAWSDFSADRSNEATFDLVLHDLGNMVVREGALPRVLDLVRPGGLLVLDDLHKPRYRATATRLLRERSWPHLSLWLQTRDSLDRHAWVAQRPLDSVIT